jgi:hypothetical protein
MRAPTCIVRANLTPFPLQECHIAQNDDGSWGSGAASCGNVHGTAYFSVDNGYDFYVNGEKIGVIC